MSDITPADALRELGDDQAEYAAAAAKKLGLPESVEYVEMRTEYGLRDSNGEVWCYYTREAAESAQEVWGVIAETPGPRPQGADVLLVHEVITTAWREVTP